MYKKASQRQQEAARRYAYYPPSSSNNDGTLAGLITLAVIGGVIWGTVKVVQGGIWVGKRLVRLATGTNEDSRQEEESGMEKSKGLSIGQGSDV